MTPNRIKRKASGLTIVELLVAVTLTAILITSIAVAMHASLENYSVNKRLANGTHISRRVLNNIAETIRTADAVQFADGEAVLEVDPPGASISSIKYELVNNKLVYSETIDGTTTSSDLIGGSSDDVIVTSFEVTKVIGKDSDDVDCTSTVIIKLSLTIDGQVVNMRASASPRRNQEY